MATAAMNIGEVYFLELTMISASIVHSKLATGSSVDNHHWWLRFPSLNWVKINAWWGNFQKAFISTDRSLAISERLDAKVWTERKGLLVGKDSKKGKRIWDAIITFRKEPITGKSRFDAKIELVDV